MKTMLIDKVVVVLTGMIMALSSCLKDNADSVNPSIDQTYRTPVVNITNISDITPSTAIISGSLVDDGGDYLTIVGLCWSVRQNPTASNDLTMRMEVLAGSFKGTISGLDPNTKYYVRSFAINKAGTAYCDQVSFETSKVRIGGAPSILTEPVTSITAISAVSGGNITDDGGSDILSRGITWSENPEWSVYDNDNTMVENGTGTGKYSSFIPNLKPNTTYYVKAFAATWTLMTYGQTLSFKTDSLQSSSSGVIFHTDKDHFPGFSFAPGQIQ
jgi:hypothetical protein